jgi:hypothetical protein
MGVTLAGNYGMVDGLGQSKAAVSTSERWLEDGRCIERMEGWERGIVTGLTFGQSFLNDNFLFLGNFLYKFDCVLEEDKLIKAM